MANSSVELAANSTCKNLMALYSPAEPITIKSPMDVFLRVRDFTKDESKKAKEKCIEIANDNRIIVHLPKDSATYKNVQNNANVKHQFTFSQIFGGDVVQKNFYSATVHNTVQRFLWGENCLIFAYGATNSGKTHTVQGTLTNPGILPRALDVIFNSIGDNLLYPISVKPNLFDNISKLSAVAQKQERLNKEHFIRWGRELDLDGTTADSLLASKIGSSLCSSEESLTSYRSYESLTTFKDGLSQIEHRVHSECKVDIPNVESFAFSVWVSFAEIYNEYVYDLFQPFANTRSKKRTSLKLCEDKNGNVFVKGLQRMCVSSADEAMKLLITGTKNLRFAATAINQNSSRSHCIFTIEIIRTPDKENPKVATISRLSFCDLAGSERYSKTKNTGDRLKEACNINSSLLVLGRCISTLRMNQHLNRETMKLIPFRESKLTRLFQYYFTHRSAVSMIVNISPEPGMCDESLHVLKFSALAEKVFIVPQNEIKPARSRATILMEAAAARMSVAWTASEEEDNGDSDSEFGREELFDYIEQLESDIKKLKREKDCLETKIRQEVANEASVVVHKLEKFYSEKIEEEKELAEQYAEKRIAMCIQQTEAARKRQKEDVSDDEYENELEEKNKNIKELNLTVEELKTENGMLREQLKALRQSNTRLSISHANLRRKSSQQMFDNSYKKKSSVDTSWLSVTSEEGNEAYLELESKHDSLKKAYAEEGAKLLEAKDEIARLTELRNVYEQRLACQADKKKKLTMDNALLKKEILNKEFQSMKLSWKEDIKEEEKENADVDNQADSNSTCPEPLGSGLKTPKQSPDTDMSSSELSPITPETVKRLYKPSANVLLTSPIEDKKESETSIHSRILEQIQLE